MYSRTWILEPIPCRAGYYRTWILEPKPGQGILKPRYLNLYQDSVLQDLDTWTYTRAGYYWTWILEPKPGQGILKPRYLNVYLAGQGILWRTNICLVLQYMCCLKIRGSYWPTIFTPLFTIIWRERQGRGLQGKGGGDGDGGME